MQLNTDGFQGTVYLKDWRKDVITGRSFIAVMGTVRILSAADAVGFDATNRESNWIARIEGATTSYNFPGCQVGLVVDHPGVTEPNEIAADAVLVAQ